MRHRLRAFFYWLLRKTYEPQPDQRSTIRKLNTALVEMATRDEPARAAYLERVAELVEARNMAGAGPWQVSPSALRQTDRIIDDARRFYAEPVAVRESLSDRGACGDLELALQNVEWRRETQLSYLEFSRWGIQQLVLICRLYYIKHPWIRRGVNLSASYVFGQGVELSSPDPDANEALKRFRDRNRVTLGQIGLTAQEKRKSYDGNIFWCLFPDTQNSGETNVRVIDTTEIVEIVADANDADQPQFYRREWTARNFNTATGQWENVFMKRWYPALNYEPADRPQMIADTPVAWDSPIYHRKVGAVASWAFGCPRVYPALDWAKEGRRHLTACANVTAALSEIAINVITKGGQQAIDSLEKKLRPPSSDVADLLEGPRSGGTFIGGPGTKVEAFKSRGAGAHPEEVKEYRNMTACALEIPPTWLGDMETSNLSTAQTLDRPTELGFLLKQQEWQEDLTTMGIYALRVSKQAPAGRLRETLQMRKVADIEIREAQRVQKRTPAGNTHWVYEATKIRKPGIVEVLCNFPAIREGDIQQLVDATVRAMTLGTQGIVGIDEKAGVRKLFDLLGIADGDQLVETMYPTAEYQMERTAIEEPVLGAVGASVPKVAPTATVGESARVRRAIARVEAALERENGHVPTHSH